MKLKKTIQSGLLAWNQEGETLRPEREQTDRDPFRFRASQLGYCMRMQTYEWIHGRTEFSPDQLLRVHTGEVMGQAVAELIGRTETIDTEVYGKRAFKFRGQRLLIDGHVDIVIHREGKKIPVEIKHVGEGSYWKMWHQGSPFESHEAQIRTYMELLGVKTGIILARREGGETLEFPVERNFGIWTRHLRRCYTVGKARAENKLAPREYHNPKAPPCTWCPFKEKCW